MRSGQGFIHEMAYVDYPLCYVEIKGSLNLWAFFKVSILEMAVQTDVLCDLNVGAVEIVH